MDAAYSDTMAIMVTVATALSVIPLGLSLLMPDWYLGDQQNAVEDMDAPGRSRQPSLDVSGTDEGEEGEDDEL